ncbi:carboxymuconolactone decarboxylase family protein [bacterium]|nr:carboxymuconolactone decarboxylase family protein [bacterium]
MKNRLNPYHSAAKLMAEVTRLEAEIAGAGLERGLIHLVKTRASQINGCAYCINLHTAEALAEGETPQRLFLLDAWREAPLYSHRERAALAWTEAVTLVAQTHVPDEVFNEVRAYFDEADLVRLTLVVGMINVWNRIAISFRAMPAAKAERPAA